MYSSLLLEQTVHLHEYKIHIVCNYGEVRLVGGENEIYYNINGILEYRGDVHGAIDVCENEQWSYICDADWTMEDASVACRELGNAQLGWFSLKITYHKILWWLNNRIMEGHICHIILCLLIKEDKGKGNLCSDRSQMIVDMCSSQ